VPREQAGKGRAAIRQRGLIEERSREVWQWATVESIAADLKLVLRRCGDHRIAATVLLTLAIGSGEYGVFSVLNSVLIRPLPYPDGATVAMRSERPGAPG